MYCKERKKDRKHRYQLHSIPKKQRKKRRKMRGREENKEGAGV